MEEIKGLGSEASPRIEVETQANAKEIYWRNQLKKYKRSGLSQKKFCELNGLKLKTLSRWKSYFKKAKRKSLKKKVLLKSEDTLKPEESINFLSVELLEPLKLKEEEVERAKVLFHHQSGFSLELEEKSNQELFKLGLSLLMELARC